MVQIGMVLALLLSSLLSIACFSLVAAVFGLVLSRKLSQKYEAERERLASELTEALRAFITAPDEKTPSPLAVLCDQGATLLAARLVQNVKAMLAGVESGVAKGEQLALIESATKDSPWLSLLANALPKRVRNALLKNPQMIGALSKVGNLSGNHGAGDSAAPRRHRE
jgi:hypothetical protein